MFIHVCNIFLSIQEASDYQKRSRGGKKAPKADPEHHKIVIRHSPCPKFGCPRCPPPGSIALTGCDATAPAPLPTQSSVRPCLSHVSKSIKVKKGHVKRSSRLLILFPRALANHGRVLSWVYIMFFRVDQRQRHRCDRIVGETDDDDNDGPGNKEDYRQRSNVDGEAFRSRWRRKRTVSPESRFVPLYT